MTKPPRPRATPRRINAKIHWLIGISAGTLLMLIGLTGALLAFEDELLDLLNPGVRHVPPRAHAALNPAELLAALPALPAGESIRMLVFSAEAGRSVEIHARVGTSNLPPRYADPYTAAWLGNANGHAFFAWCERLHRFLLLPREPGRQVSGALACALLLLALTGIHLRWPRQPARLRSWLTYRRGLEGRAYWWSVHAVIATWALPAWLLLAGTGIYWSYDAVRNPIDRWAGLQRAAGTAQRAGTAPLRPDLSLAWPSFAAAAPDWRSLRVRLPERAGDASEWQWTAPDAAHERQRNRLSIWSDGRVADDQRFAELPLARRALAAIHPLHMGSYFGLPGRLLMALAALALPLIGLSGWLLYLKRRRQQRTTRLGRQTRRRGQQHPAS